MKQLIGVLLVLALFGCAPSVVQDVGGHKFLIPKRQVFRKQMFWMPFKDEGIAFILNPDDPLPYQNAVELSTVRESCPKGLTPGGNSSAYLCSLKNIIRPGSNPIPAASLNKVMGDMGKAVWTYTLHDADGDHIIASCSDGGPGEKRGGLCSGIGNYKDLLMSVHFREIDIPRLPILVATTQAMLSKWETAAK